MEPDVMMSVIPESGLCHHSIIGIPQVPQLVLVLALEVVLLS
jgi:hypothetical protein